MGAIKGGKEWEGAIVNSYDVDGIVKDGEVVWESERYYMGVLNSIPATGAELKNQLSLQPIIKEGNQYVIKADGVSKYFVVAIPEERTLISIRSSNNEELYSNLEPEENSNFKLNTEITTIPKDGVQQPYKVYVMNTAIPFSLSMKFIVKII